MKIEIHMNSVMLIPESDWDKQIIDTLFSYHRIVAVKEVNTIEGTSKLGLVNDHPGLADE